MERLARAIKAKEEELRLIEQKPINTVEGHKDGSAVRPDIAEQRREAKAEPIKEKLEELRGELRLLEGRNVGGGKKKRTYKKKKRTPMKKKRRSQKKRKKTPMKKKIK